MKRDRFARNTIIPWSTRTELHQGMSRLMRRRFASAAALASCLLCRVRGFSLDAGAPASSSAAAAPPVPRDASPLGRMQSRHRDVAASFAPGDFRPLPAFSNRHLQTILGVFLRGDGDCAYVTEPGIAGLSKILRAVRAIEPAAKEDECDFWDARVDVDSGCGLDFFHADVKYAGKKQGVWQSAESEGMVILIHGLESNSNSSLSTEMANAYVEDGFDVVCLNFRGCSGVPNDTIGGYHLGFTDDLKSYLDLIRRAWDEKDMEQRPIYLSGFSLGANVVVKALGELGETARTLYNIHGAAVTGAPYDLERNVRYLDAPGFNRAIYSSNFLKTLKTRAEYQLATYCEGDPLTATFDYPRVMSATSMADFDDAFIAPVYGFESNVDYYRQSSCYYFLDRVAVPTYIVNAGDDPFFDPGFRPVEKSVDGGGAAPIKMKFTQHGGHLGYLFHQLNEAEKREARSSSWMPHELARFIHHVHQYDHALASRLSVWHETSGFSRV